MSRRKSQGGPVESEGNGDDASIKRQRIDYQFECHADDGTITTIPLIMHYPTEASRVAEFLNRLNLRGDVFNGKVRVCKKIYA